MFTLKRQQVDGLAPPGSKSALMTRSHIDGLAVRPLACPLGSGAGTGAPPHPQGSSSIATTVVEVYDVCDYEWWSAHAAEDLLVEGGQTADNPYGMKLWPGAVALAQRLAALDPATLANLRVLELGCGNGLCSLACAALGCKAVLATDISERALGLVRGAAADQGFGGRVKTAPFDVCGPDPLPACDLVLVADLILYDDALSAHLARRCAEACARGTAFAVAGDPQRRGRPHFVERMRAHARGGESDEPFRSLEPPETRRARLDRLPEGAFFFEPPVSIGLEAAKWKAKKVEMAVVDGDNFNWPRGK